MIGTLEFVQGDVTYPRGDGFRILAHIVNDLGRWGSGVVLAISKRWESPERMYRLWHRGGSFGIPFELGNVQFVPVGYNYIDISDKNIIVANMLAQKGLKSRENPKPVCYSYLQKCLSVVSDTAIRLSASVHVPYKMGCVRSGGKWVVVEQMLREELVSRGVSVYVYNIGE
jgi:O-acetyl-ADP-ribose deacetylase (regulator of RNase III)